jgi:hypothetical protein
MKVQDGRLVLPDGMSYRLLKLPPAETMTPVLLRKIRELVNAGATVVGARPLKSPSLVHYPQCDVEAKQLAQEMWDNCDGNIVTEHRYGKGRVVQGKTPASVLADMRVPPDFEYRTKNRLPKLRYTHRTLNGMNIYFVANQSDATEEAECLFRVSGRRPELWRPETGKIERTAVHEESDGRVRLSIRFHPAESLFVVFRSDAANVTDSVAKDNQSAEGVETSVAVAATPASQEISGPWELRFAPGGGAPERVLLDKLISWTNHGHAGIRYYSGAATYINTFNVPAGMISSGRRLLLDLGKVQVIADVKLNGKNLGILWKMPFQVDVTDCVSPEKNLLEVKVVNLWPNRMIGDEQMPEDSERDPNVSLYGMRGPVLVRWPQWLLEGKSSPTGRYTFTTWKHWPKDSPLLESGLLGPVTLHSLSARQ